MSVNEQLRDSEVTHQIRLHRYANGVVRRIVATLNRSDARIFAAIQDLADQIGTFTATRLEQMLYAVRELNKEVFDTIGRELTPELHALVKYEAGYQHKLFQSVLPAQIQAHVGVATVDVEQTYAAALARPFQGVLLNQALDGLADNRAKLIRQTLASGYVEGKTIDQMTRELRGTRTQGYADGLFNRSRNDTEAVVRTATSHYAAFTRQRFVQANQDLIAAQTWTSTLDGRTTEFCILRDGLEYTSDDPPKPVGHKLPWGGGPGAAHWNCRSCSTPITKSFRDLGIDIDEFSPSTRASMNGQVPASQTYGEWLKKQPASVQDEVLGPTRGKLLRDGGLTVDRFANDRGKWLTLAELEQRDAQAFKRAGL